MSTEERGGPGDDTRRAAWAWLRTFHSGTVKPQDAERFKRWLASDPAHAAAFKEARAQWAEVGSASARVLRSNPEAARLHARHADRPRSHRRAFLGAAVSAAVVAGVVIARPPDGLWPAPDEWWPDDRTATGEQRTLMLAGRVQVTLNTQTRIRRQIVSDETIGIDLLSGEAAVDLPDDRARRPFAVVAGVGRSLSDAGRFEVRHLAGKVCVTCIEGLVKVEHPAGIRELRGRQQTVYDGSAVSGIAAVATQNLAAWRNGELVFTQTRLADVLDEINRYRPGRVMLMNASVRDKPVTGSFYIASLDLALAQLQHAFNLGARSLPGGLVLLS